MDLGAPTTPAPQNVALVSAVLTGEEEFDQQRTTVTSYVPTLLTLGAVLLLPTQEAFAGGSEYGILAGRTASMLHPVTMLLLFATSVYSGYLGLQWRRLRGLSDEIKDLQQQAPRLSTGLATFPLSASISALNEKLKTAVEPAVTGKPRRARYTSLSKSATVSSDWRLRCRRQRSPRCSCAL
jgi:hypothetical protein